MSKLLTSTISPHPSKSRIRPTCPNRSCHNANVYLSLNTIVWDIEKQEWVIDSFDDVEMFCSDCDNRIYSLDWISFP